VAPEASDQAPILVKDLQITRLLAGMRVQRRYSNADTEGYERLEDEEHQNMVQLQQKRLHAPLCAGAQVCVHADVCVCVCVCAHG